MLRHGVARMIISNIPIWMGGIEIMPAPQDYKRIIDWVPAGHFLVDFQQDRWDFRDGFRMQYRYQNLIDFNSCHEEVKDHVKGFAVKNIDEGTKISTLHTTIRILTQVLNSAITDSRRKMLLFLGTTDVTDAIKKTQNSLYDQLTAHILISRFVEYLEKEENMHLCIDLKLLDRDKKYVSDRLGARHQHTHHPDIPNELFDELISMFDRVMRDESIALNDRLTAGIMLIDSQIGLRKSELPALETDFFNTYLCDDGIERPYIVYNCIKAAKGDVESIPFTTICTALCRETIEYYMQLRDKCVYAHDTDFLYIQDPVPGRKRNGQFPIDTQTAENIYQRLCIRHIPDVVMKDWKGIKKIKVTRKEELYSIPTIHSFRVHFASMLYKAGYPLDFIECAMSHTPNSNFNECYYGGVEADIHHGRIVVNEKDLDAFDNFLNSFDDDTSAD